MEVSGDDELLRDKVFEHNIVNCLVLQYILPNASPICCFIKIFIREQKLFL